MNEIKNAIGTLCQHLNVLFNVDLIPEHFRLAKFNKTEENVVPLFWNVLNKFAQPSSLDTVNNVKLFLYNQNYKSLNFYCLPNDMSYGSRDLLLALGFIISGNSLDNVIYDKIAKTPLNPDFNMFPAGAHKCINFNVNQLKTDRDKINAVTWMKSKLASNKRMIGELELQVVKMLNKVNDIITITNVEALSLNEIMALKKKDFSTDFLAKTEQVMNILETREKWMKKEKIFWNWMNSVLAESSRSEYKIDYEIFNRFQTVVSNNK